MKYNCFDDLLSICQTAPSASKNTIDSLKESSKRKKNCIIYAQKQFVPPIDREDIVRLAVMLHDLNSCLFSVAEYNFLNEFEPLSSIINKGYLLARNCLKNKLKIDIDEVLSERDRLCVLFINERQKNTIETTINTKVLIKAIFFDKIDKCFEKIISVIDEMIFISIKNS